jgi:hypothetical protein
LIGATGIGIGIETGIEAPEPAYNALIAAQRSSIETLFSFALLFIIVIFMRVGSKLEFISEI